MLDLLNDPVDIVDDTCWSHLFSNVSNALNNFLDDFFVNLIFHSMFEVREENLVKELLYWSRKMILNRKTGRPFKLFIFVLFSKVELKLTKRNLSQT